ncbi:hypothetical protein BaRGS_00034075 [Batillaria attramentaria]|uniref:Tetratricopeptide repeat-containing protein n=1 Tax=Batillaria attramentaria TaxID=370345 RepID=A0ABD0JIE3_9CAEN
MAFVLRCARDPEDIKRRSKIEKITPLEACKIALELGENDPAVLRKAGRIYRYYKLINESRNLLERSVELQPSSEAYHHLGLTYKYLATASKYGTLQKKKKRTHKRRNAQEAKAGRRRKETVNGQGVGEMEAASSGMDTAQAPKKTQKQRRNQKNMQETDRAGVEEATVGQRAREREVDSGRGSRGQAGSAKRKDTAYNGDQRHKRRVCEAAERGETQNPERGPRHVTPSRNGQSFGIGGGASRTKADDAYKTLGAVGGEPLCSQPYFAEKSPGGKERENGRGVPDGRLRPESPRQQRNNRPDSRSRFCTESSSVEPSAQRGTCTALNSQDDSCVESFSQQTGNLSLRDSCSWSSDRFDEETEKWLAEETQFAVDSDSDTEAIPAVSPKLDSLSKIIKSPPSGTTTFSRDCEYVQKAVHCLQQAVEFSAEENTRAMYDLALLFKSLEEYDDALAYLEKICENNLENEESSAGPLDVVTAFEQRGLIMRTLSEREQDRERKMKLKKEAGRLLNHALITASRLYSNCAEVQGRLTDVFRSPRALFEAVDASDRSKAEKQTEKARLFQLIKKHRKAIAVLQKMAKANPQLEHNPQYHQGIIQNHCEMDEFVEAVTCFELLRATELGREVRQLLGERFVTGMYMQAGKQALLQPGTKVSPHFKKCLCRCAQSATEKYRCEWTG